MLSVKHIILAIFVVLMGTACHTNQPPDAARIHGQKSSELVEWLNREKLPEDLKDRDPFFMEAICDELAARREVDFLLASFNVATNESARDLLVSDVLSRIDDRRIYNAFAQRLNDEEDRESYGIAVYLAERGNTAALATLNRHYFQYEVSSVEWAYVAEIFGKYRYMPAATNLVTTLDAASLNLSAASCNALQQIFPDSPKHFTGPTEAESYYIKRLSEAPKR